MKVKPVQFKILTILFMVALVLFFNLPQPLIAQQEETSSLGIVIKVSGLEKLMDLIDELMSVGTEGPKGSPTVFLRGMLYGANWIDPGRLIVMSVDVSTDQPVGIILIPFKEKNNDFQAAYNASTGLDYYLLTIPSDRKDMIKPHLETALVDISKTKASTGLTVETAPVGLLKNEKIHNWIDEIKNLASTSEGQPPGLSPKEITSMITNILDTANQIELFSMGFFIDETKFAARLAVKALKESDLAKLFVEGGRTSRMGGYRSDRQINFRTNAFQVEGLVRLLDATFGEFYKTMGIDLSDVVEISQHLTGESAGGLSFDKENVHIEMINVLKNASASADFLDSIYLPWLTKYGETIKNMLETQLQTKIQQIFVRTPESTVSSHKVVGVKIQLPTTPILPDIGKSEQQLVLMSYEMRMTTVRDLLITAPDDQRMEQLIKIAESLKESPAEGPLMAVDIDTAGYLKALAEMMPFVPGQGQHMPKMEKMHYRFDMKNGQADGTYTIQMSDIKSMIAYFQNKTEPAVRLVRPAPKVPAEEEPKKVILKRTDTTKPKIVEIAAKAPAKTPVKDASYYIGQGNLFSFYGNDKAAIKNYKKAIELDPRSSEAYFQMGMSYGELKDYQKALSSINKAIELNPQKGLYYYGRGRIYLISENGDKDRAIEEFKKAAKLGDRDAQNYLKNTLRITWE